jgi:hypothetical protein
MAETKKIMSWEERRQHLHNIIVMSKKNKEEAQAEFEKKCETPEYTKIFERLREANAKRGIIIPGE